MMQACDELNILREKNRKNPKWINRGLYRQLYNPNRDIHNGKYDGNSLTEILDRLHFQNPAFKGSSS
jgi:hypothetical protein